MESQLKPTYDELLQENATLRVENAELRAENAALKLKVSTLEARVAELEAKVEALLQTVAEKDAYIAKLEKMLFGKKSEKSKKKDEAPVESAAEVTQDDTASEEPKKKRPKNGGGGKKPFPPGISRRDVYVDVPLDDRICSCCGTEYVDMGVEITEVLNRIPAILEIIRLIRRRYRQNCTCGTFTVVVADQPIRTIDNGCVTTEFVASILVDKYCDHLPIHRQMDRTLKNSGVTVSESSVCRWRDAVADNLKPLVELMKEEILLGNCINNDATGGRYRIPEEGHRSVNGNVHVFIGDNYHPYNVFEFYENQSAEPLKKFFEGYTGKIQCDAHGNYDAIFAPKNKGENVVPPTEVGCNAHCRRKFDESKKLESELAEKFLGIYRKIYKIEKECRDMTPEERLLRRKSDTVPLFDTLFELCREVQSDPFILPKSPLGQAVAYALKNEMALRRPCEDGSLAMDNNIAERTLRSVVLGRKNWLFYGSVVAAHNSMTIMSVLSSARRHGLNEWEYLTDILYRLSDGGSSAELREMLPNRWQKSSAAPCEMAELVSEVSSRSFYCKE